MTAQLIAKVPFKHTWTAGDYDTLEHFDTFDEVPAHDGGRQLILVIKDWKCVSEDTMTEDGLETEPEEERVEFYSGITPIQVVDYLRLHGLEFGAYGSYVGEIAVNPNGSDTFEAYDGTRTEKVEAFLRGFTPLQLAVINAWTDARP